MFYVGLAQVKHYFGQGPGVEYLKWLVTLKFYKCAYATPHLHKISNLSNKIVSTGQFTFDYKVLKRYMIPKIVKQGII